MDVFGYKIMSWPPNDLSYSLTPIALPYTLLGVYFQCPLVIPLLKDLVG